MKKYWPPEMAMGLLIAQEKQNGNWDYLAETLWAGWPELRLFVRNPARSLASFLSESDDAQKEGLLRPPWLGDFKMDKAQKGGFLELLWMDRLQPLLESLIKTNRAEDAETVILDIAKLPVFGDFRYRATGLAEDYGRGDLSRKWTAMEIPAKQEVTDMDDLEACIGATSWIVPTIVLMGADKSDIERVGAMLIKGMVVDWRWVIEPLDPRFSDLMRTREGWPKGAKHWALIDTDRTILGGGPGLPTDKDILHAFEQSEIEHPVMPLRRFVSEHPSHMDAKGFLLVELKRVAEYRAMEAIELRWGAKERWFTKKGALDRLAKALAENEDTAIWGECAALYRQVLPLSMRYAQAKTEDNQYKNLLLFSSMTMKDVAKELLPLVEAQMKRRPMDEFLWHQWASLSGLGEERYFGDLKNTLALSPLDDPLDLPPQKARDILLSRYGTNENWQGIIDLHEWRWEAMRDGVEFDIFADDKRLISVVRPLLDAYLRTGKDKEAEAVVETLVKRNPAGTMLLFFAVGLARDCGRGALARRGEKNLIHWINNSDWVKKRN
jgi:hypothetical protein